MKPLKHRVIVCAALQAGRRWSGDKPSEASRCQERVHKAWLANTAE